MGIHRHAAATDANQKSIVKALRAVGAVVYIIREPTDLLVGFNRQWILMEVKDTKGRLTPAQDDFFKESTDVGGVAAVVRNVDEALTLIGCETRGVEVGPHIFSSPWLDGRGTE